MTVSPTLRLIAGSLMITAVVVAGGEAMADQFRLVQQDTGAYLGYARVDVRFQAGIVRYTDYTGFVEIDLPSGKYSVTVTWGSSQANVELSFDNRPGVKVIEVQ